MGGLAWIFMKEEVKHYFLKIYFFTIMNHEAHAYNPTLIL